MATVDIASIRLSARPSIADITGRDCMYWQENPTINPRPNAAGINQTITPASQPYKTYQKNCFTLFIKNLFEGTDPFKQLELKIKNREFSTKESYEDEWTTIMEKIQPAFNMPSIPINDTVKIAYNKYITNIKQKLDGSIERILNPQIRSTARGSRIETTPVSRTPEATLPAPGIERTSISPSVARVLSFGEQSPVTEQSALNVIRSQVTLYPRLDSLITLITTLSAPDFSDDLLKPYSAEIYGRNLIQDVFMKKIKNVKQRVNIPVIDTVISYLYLLNKSVIEDEEYFEPNFDIEKFIQILVDLIEFIILADRYLIRYDNYSDNYMYSILTIIGGFYHKYKDNFDYITPIVKSLRIFTALKLEKLTNKLKPRANSVVNPFTEDELNRCIYLIKMQLIADLELEAFFSKSKNKEKIIQVLNVDEGADSKEVYLYVLKFILYDVDYSPYIAIHPKKLKYLDSKIRPSLQKSNETMKEPESIEIEQEMILDKCKNVLSSINPYYNKYRLMFQTRCTSLFEKCIDIQEIRNKIMSKYPIRVPETTLDVNVEDVDIRGIERKDALATLFRKWYSYNSQDKKEFWLRYFNVVFKGEAGIFTGPGRELIQICLQSIQEELGDLFIPVDSGSKRMMLHPDFKPTTRFLEKAKIKEWNLEIKKEIVQFIGGLFTRALLLNIEIPISLSYYTLSYLYYKNNIEDDTYGFYYLIDMPDASKDQFKLMEMDPDTIEYVDLNFNDVYPLIKEDELITKDNVTKYINSIAKYSLTKPDQPEYKELLDAFFKGFLLKRTFLLDNGINIRYLDKLLNESGGTINEKKLKQFIDTRLNFELSKKLDETAPFEEKEKRAKLIKHQEQIKEWFIKLLNTNGTDFPYEKIGIDKPTTEEKQKVFALSDFLPKLMYFWTSSYNINLFDSYIVNIYQSDIVNKLPSAHTCVKTIDIPSSYTSYNELFEKLATAVYNTQGFAFAGGDMINKCIQKVLKNNLLNKDHNKAIQVGLITMIKSHKQLTKKQKKKLIKYVENEAINFKIATKREIKQWGKQLCKQMKMI